MKNELTFILILAVIITIIATLTGYIIFLSSNGTCGTKIILPDYISPGYCSPDNVNWTICDVKNSSSQFTFIPGNGWRGSIIRTIDDSGYSSNLTRRF